MRPDFAHLELESRKPGASRLVATAEGRTEARMVPFFVQIKCQLGKSYEVANGLADAEIASGSIRPLATSTCW
jgi:hypothetical protein